VAGAAFLEDVAGVVNVSDVEPEWLDALAYSRDMDAQCHHCRGFLGPATVQELAGGDDGAETLNQQRGESEVDRRERDPASPVV